jgi:anaerobic C4-dicarboxylate transporter
VPDIPGKYTVIATFTGSEAYYGSYDQATFVVDEAHATTPTTTPGQTSSAAETYLLPGIIAIIIAIIVGFAITILVLRKRP